MVPSHLRWLETEAPEVLPSAARAHRLLLFGWLPLLAVVAVGAWFTVRDAAPGSDPVFLGGVVLLVTSPKSPKSSAALVLAPSAISLKGAF